MGDPRVVERTGAARETIAALEVKDGVSVHLYQQPFTIGRSRSCSLTIGDGRLSSTHCRIERDGEEHKLVLLGYTPVLVNGITAGQFVYLRDGDQLVIGELECTFRAPKRAGKTRRKKKAKRAVVEPLAPGESVEPEPEPRPAARPVTSRRTHSLDREVDLDTLPPLLMAGLAVIVVVVVGGLAYVAGHGEGAMEAQAPVVASAPVVEREEAPPVRVDDEPGTVVGSSAGAVVEQDVADPEPPRGDALPAERVEAPVRRPSSQPKAQPKAQPKPQPTRRPLPGEATEDDVGADPFARDLPAEERGGGSEVADGARKLAGASSGTTSTMKEPPPPKDEGGSKEVPIRFLDEEVYGKRIAFVLDHSASMAPLWGQVQQELVGTLRALTPKHDFSLVLYNNTTQIFSRRWQPGKKDRVEKAIEWVTSTPAKGATDPEPALRIALRMKGIEALVFLSDCKFRKRTERIYQLLKLATKGTKSFKPIKLWYFPVSDHPGVARIMSLSSGRPAGSLEMRLRGIQRR